MLHSLLARNPLGSCPPGFKYRCRSQAAFSRCFHALYSQTPVFKPRKGNSGGRFRAADGDLSSQDIEVLPNFGVTDDDAQGSLQEDEIKEMLLFAVPALGMVLADPLMSLIDTACVGQVSAVQLAALGPNTAVFSFVFQLFAFLGTATTSIIASNSPRVASLGAGDREARIRAAQATLSNSLCLALACGVLATAVLLTWGRAFLVGMGTPAEVLAPAVQYLQIRALAAPAVMVMNVSQGACLGQQDARTPFAVLAAAGVLNAAGDIYMISCRGAGVAGAAAATTFAQYVGAAYFLWHLWRMGRQRGGVPLKFAGIPTLESMAPFFRIAVTLFGRTIFGMASYFAMTVSATRMGVLQVAAHQVAMQVFWFLTYIPEPLSLAAQSLIARDKYAPRKARQWAWLLLKAGAALGLALAALLAGVLLGGTWVFTSDAAVQGMIGGLTPVAVVAVLLCSTMMMFDGISIGAGDYLHLPSGIAAGLALTLSVLWLTPRLGLGLKGVWWALVAFYASRLGGHVVHFVGKRGRTVFSGAPAAGRA